MMWLCRGCEPFRGYAAHTLHHMWTRDPTCNIQIPAVCSLWHRITEHQTWPTHRYWFCLSPFWQQQDSPCRILSLVSTYFIIIYLVCGFSVVVFGSYISGDFNGDSWLLKWHRKGGLSWVPSVLACHTPFHYCPFQVRQSTNACNIPAHIPSQITI
jgi:hypothetical protein